MLSITPRREALYYKAYGRQNHRPTAGYHQRSHVDEWQADRGGFGTTPHHD